MNQAIIPVQQEFALPRISIGFGIALVIVGIAGFVPHHAPTALIPAYLGIALIVCGLLAMKPTLRMHAIHGAVTLALLGFFASAGRLAVSLTRPRIDSLAASCLSLMAVLCVVFVFLCVRSFIDARRARTLE